MYLLLRLLLAVFGFTSILLFATIFCVRSLWTETAIRCEVSNCWHGITPGSTTAFWAHKLLLDIYRDENVVLNRHTIQWNGNSVDGLLGGFLRMDNQGIVFDMEVGFRKNRLTVAELITQFGEPSTVFIGRAFSDEYLCAGSILAFPDKGVVAWLYVEGEYVGVNPAQSAQSLMFLSLEQASKWRITDHFVFEWQGFTDYCMLAEMTLSP